MGLEKGLVNSAIFYSDSPAGPPDSVTQGRRPLALVKNGDALTNDVAKRMMDLHISKAEMVKRKAAWKQPKPRYTKGVPAKCVSSASKSAVKD